MALPSRHVDSCMGTHLSRYPMNHPAIDNTGCTEEKERAASWQEQKETKTWGREDQDNHPNPPTPKG